MEEKDEKVISPEKMRNFWRLLALPILMIVPLAAEFSTIISYVQDFLANAISEAKYGIGRKLSPEATYTISPIAAASFLALLIFAAYVTYALFLLSRSLRERRINTLSVYDIQNNEIQRMKKIDEKRMEYLGKLVHQLYGESNRARHNIISVEAKYFVGENGDMSVEKVITLQATRLPVQFYKFFVEGDDMSMQAAGMEDIDFKVESLDNNCDVVYLLITNRVRHKQIVIWFLPEIQVGKERRIKITYKWPGLLRGLQLRRKIDFSWKYTSLDSDWKGNIKFRFKFSESYAKVIAENTGEAAQPVKLDSFYDGTRTEVTFSGENVLIGNTKYELTFALDN